MAIMCGHYENLDDEEQKKTQKEGVLLGGACRIACVSIMSEMKIEWTGGFAKHRLLVTKQTKECVGDEHS